MSLRVLLAHAAMLAAMAATHAEAQDAARAETPPGTGSAVTPAAQSKVGEAATGDAILQPPEEDPLHFSFSPYVWLTSISGDVTIRGIQVDATKSFVEILQDSDKVFGLMGAVDLDYKGFVFQFNGAWSTAKVTETKAVVDVGSATSEVELDTAWLEAFGGYRFLDRSMEQGRDSPRRFTIDGFAGVRYTLIDTNVRLTAVEDITLPDGAMFNAGQTARRDQSQDWFEPFVGARLGLDLSEHWAMELRGDVGGFGVSGSDFAWQIAALIGYRWQLEGWDVGLFGGYRALAQDYSNGDFGWDAVMHGPVLGAQFSWAF